MFHRITLESVKLNGARPVEPHSNSVQLHHREGSESPSTQDNGNYDELYFEKEPESFFRLKLHLAFLLYLTIGTVYFDYSPANGVDIKGVLGFYQVRKEAEIFLCARQFSQSWIGFGCFIHSTRQFPSVFRSVYLLEIQTTCKMMDQCKSG